MIRDMKKMIRFLRTAGRDKLIERIHAIQNEEDLPDDILTNILKACSNNLN